MLSSVALSLQCRMVHSNTLTRTTRTTSILVQSQAGQADLRYLADHIPPLRDLGSRQHEGSTTLDSIIGDSVLAD